MLTKGPEMSWQLIQGCTRPMSPRNWDRLQHPPCDPERGTAVKLKVKKRFQTVEVLRVLLHPYPDEASAIRSKTRLGLLLLMVIICKMFLKWVLFESMVSKTHKENIGILQTTACAYFGLTMFIQMYSVLVLVKLHHCSANPVSL